ncbi:MAG: hypothetical protein PHV34_12910 [Verrucomicrobiae bacterium]|nr:hypothetical protein [Verrucomicrobiae bacterium]
MSFVIVRLPMFISVLKLEAELMIFELAVFQGEREIRGLDSLAWMCSMPLVHCIFKPVETVFWE